MKSQPIDGKYGIFGGKYVPETLMNVVNSLEKRYEEIEDYIKNETDEFSKFCVRLYDEMPKLFEKFRQ